jgi:transcriptional regulator with XRE-family HTH domain
MNSTSDKSAPAEDLDLARLAEMIREHRGGLSLRNAASEAGVSFSTLTRVEAGFHQPDMTSFVRLCAWMGVSPNEFFSPIAVREEQPIDAAIAHLAADPRLGRGAADKIADMLRSMYDALATAPTDRPVVACHLRAAGVLRPGVPQRLNAMLVEMHDKLEAKVAAGEI